MLIRNKKQINNTENNSKCYIQSDTTNKESTDTSFTNWSVCVGQIFDLSKIESACFGPLLGTNASHIGSVCVGQIMDTTTSHMLLMSLFLTLLWHVHILQCKYLYAKHVFDHILQYLYLYANVQTSVQAYTSWTLYYKWSANLECQYMKQNFTKLVGN